MQTVEPAGRPEAAEPTEYEKERGKPMPNLSHSVLELRLAVAFSAAHTDHYLVAPELTLEFADGLTLTPDLAVLPKRLIKWGREPARCREVPLLVVEIVSPSQGYQTVVEKVDAYFARGVQSVWEVNPALEIIAVHQPGSEAPQIFQQGEVKDPVTKLSVRLEELFA